jgi:hypothetical protein
MREIGPKNHAYKTGDFVKLLRNMPFGWQRDEEGKATGYDKRIQYYEGEMIRLSEGEAFQLGTMNIRPVTSKEYVGYRQCPPRTRIFACGVKRRFGYWFHWLGMFK